MFNKLYKFVVILILISINILMFTNIESNAQQKSYNYKLPFRWDETWNTDAIAGRDNYGVHQDRTGYAMDLYAPDNGSLEILAPSNGTITRGCSVNNATYLTFNSDYGDTFRFVHLRGDTTGLNQTNDSRRVNEGDMIGKVYAKGSYDSPTCSLSSEDEHVHFSWPASSCPLTIEGYTFSCDGMSICGGTYVVNCNRKHLNLKLNSTNGLKIDPKLCESLKNSDYELNDVSENIKNLQICLKQEGLYNNPKGFTGIFDEFTYLQLNKSLKLKTNKNNIAIGTLNNVDSTKKIFWQDAYNGQVSYSLLNSKGDYVENEKYLNVGPEWYSNGVGDFDADGNTDILWRNYINGKNIIWLLDKNSKVKQGVDLPIVPVNSGWKIEGIGNFNTDKVSDIVWRNPNSDDTVMWLLDKNGNFQSGVTQPKVGKTEWEISIIADMNKDKISDLIWRSNYTGNYSVWSMNSSAKLNNGNSLIPSNNDRNWQAYGVGTFGKDKDTGVFWRNTKTGENEIITLNNQQKVLVKNPVIGLVENSNKNSIWKAVLFDDFNNDQLTDIFWRGKYSGNSSAWLFDSNLLMTNPNGSFPIIL
jgi:hypothetical protein